MLQRRRVLLNDLPDRFREISEISTEQEKGWHKYWSDNPINAWIGGNSAAVKIHFQVEEGDFQFKHPIMERLSDSFSLMVQELVDFRFRQYESRLEQQSPVAVIPMPEKAAIEIPFFTDLKVACGHFRESPHDNTNIDYRPLPSKYGALEPARHFIAQASGSSMDGGSHPIKDGEYLLFELLTSDMTGSSVTRYEIREPGSSEAELTELGTVVAENREVSGHEFLVRNLEAGKSGGFILAAQNPSYPNIPLTPEIALVAKLKGILDPLELQLHRIFMRADIPPLFGLEFNKAIWETGHVCPKDITDQVLLVTLNKQGKSKSEQYHDFFVDDETFHWQSQNSTGPIGKKGKGIIEHHAQGSRVHLFVRKNKLQDGKAGAFTYCGVMDYQSHKSEKPMNVTWRLQASLSVQLYNYFTA